jgi:alkanesulfonate monooxygenase SsuD/methylene tetrahydromethanopterin reductase-like flavin-dependent oxidoreductase (luciferase family)
MTPPARFGLFLSQAGRSWDDVLGRFLMAEELGFDHAWLVDHLTPTNDHPEGPIHEAWTLLAAIAARTERIRLGVLVTSNTFRHPAVLAKEAVTVDHVSAGRLILGLGAGWHEGEHRRYGIDLPAPRERVDRLEEAVEMLIALMGAERTTYSGLHYRLDDAPLEPKPIQTPRIPLLIAAHRPRMIRLAARYADLWDTFPELAGTATDGVTTDLAERVAAFEAAAQEAGRDPAAIRRTTWAEADVAADEDRFVDFVRRHRAIGFTDFSVVPPERADLPILRRIARERIPALRAEFAADAGPPRERPDVAGS